MSDLINRLDRYESDTYEPNQYADNLIFESRDLIKHYESALKRLATYEPFDNIELVESTHERTVRIKYAKEALK